MERIWSKDESGVLLHVVHRKDDFEPERVNFADTREPLQLAALCLPGGRTFRAHKHLVHDRHVELTQELWIVIDGQVEVTYYDLEGDELCRRTLGPGDCSMTLRGGHGYAVKSAWARVYEIKTGPYLGQEADKEFIGEK